MLEVNQVYDPLKTEILKDPPVVKRGYMDLPDGGAFEEPNWSSPTNPDPWGLESTARWLRRQLAP